VNSMWLSESKAVLFARVETGFKTENLSLCLQTTNNIVSVEMLKTL